MKLDIILVTLALVSAPGAFAADWAKHPHLHHAHEAIERAKKQLSEANDHKKTEFGGHRVKAIEHLNQAQQEVKEALEYAESNAK